ncbi:MAG TPA: sigma-70 region 4 domain-containing protein [Solirubrobacteraceae bacterium]|jgi:hypothetical protein|nr:sigma-70 region 4 domain-containing protein [Solirubrobacteraceae bacterium]
MSRVEQLPADQQAVLSLLVRRGRTYAQVASVLGIDEAAVRRRAEHAVAGLGGAVPSELDSRDAGRIGDYLLGQLVEADRIETLVVLMASPGARAWARRIAAELEPITAVALPAVPVDPEAVAGEQPELRKPRRAADRGGGVLLIAAVLAIAAIVVFIIDSGGSSTPAGGPIPASAATSTTTTNSGILAEVKMTPTTRGSRAAGAAAVVQNGSSPEVAFSATNLPVPRSGHYVLWLYDSSTHFEALGEVQSVAANGSVGPLAVALPSDASSYHGVALTLEHSNSPTSPGTLVLSGASSSAL